MTTEVHTGHIGWSDGSIELQIDVAADGTVTLGRLAPGRDDGAGQAGALPLCDVILAGAGRTWSGSRYAESAAGQRLRYVSHADTADGAWHELGIELEDPQTGVRAEVVYRVLAGHGVLRSWVTLVNGGREPVTVESVTSFLAGGLPGGPGTAPLDGCDLLWAENDWLAEGRWQRRAVRDLLPDLNRAAHGGVHPRGRAGFTSEGTWSSGSYLPMGALTDRRSGRAWAWQIEHNGGWHWQVGESTGGAYLALLGPTDAEHHWQVRAGPGSLVHDRAGGRGGERRRVRGRGRRADRGAPGGPAAARGSPPAPGDLQRLHEHAEGRPDHGAVAPADRRRPRRSAPSTSASTPAGTPSWARTGGTPSALWQPSHGPVPRRPRRGARPYPGRGNGARTVARA